MSLRNITLKALNPSDDIVRSNYRSFADDNTDENGTQVNHMTRKKGRTWGPSSVHQKDKSKTTKPKSPKMNQQHRSTSAPNLDSNMSAGMAAWASTGNLGELRRVLHCAIFRATCLAILLRHKLHEKLHGVTYPAIIKPRKVAQCKALIKRERKSSQVFRKLACDDLRCHLSNVGTSRRKF